jgi:hypothetical protein
VSQKTSEAPRQRGPAQASSGQIDTNARILTDSRVSTRADHRQRQIQRFSLVAQVLAAYGPETILVSPPGPDVCPPWCPYCYRQSRRWAA